MEQTFETDETVREKRAKDKVISMYNEERLREQREERKGLSLRSLFPKPRPIWHSVTLTGTRGEESLYLHSVCGATHMCFTTLRNEKFHRNAET